MINLKIFTTAFSKLGIKKRAYKILISGLIIAIGFSYFMYLHEFQNLPEFAINLISNIKTPTASDTILIFDPHNDDAVLGVGGYMHDAVKNGAKVKLIVITNGDGHRFTTAEEYRKFKPQAKDYIQTGYTRQNETKEAAKTLGLGENDIIFLGYPDGGLKSLLTTNWNKAYTSKFTRENINIYNNSFNKNASYTGENLEKDISDLLATYQPNIVIVPTHFDIHPDHYATNEFVSKALSNYNKNYTEYYYLIHFRRWPNSKGLHQNLPLSIPGKLVPQLVWYKYNVDSSTENLKKQAILAYRSQLRSPMLKDLMQSFVRQNEILSTSN